MLHHRSQGDLGRVLDSSIEGNLGWVFGSNGADHRIINGRQLIGRRPVLHRDP